MASINKNKELWDKTYSWTNHGEEWSDWWGGSDSHWHGSILPRISAFLPATTILEIAPGHGRWTKYLLEQSKEIKLVDLSENCINTCKNRFKSYNNIEYYTNDGKSLHMIKDNSIDFAFSYDSLVHAEEDVIDSYLEELSNKLTSNGAAFFHHSNMNEYSNYYNLVRKIPRGKGILNKIGIIESEEHLRAHSMSANKFEKLCNKYSLVCISQEKINWNTRRLIDTFSVFCRKDSKWARPNILIRNNEFHNEIKYIKRLSEIYDAKSLIK